MRLNRYIAMSAGIARRKAEDVIREGRVMVNTEVVTDPAHPVVPGADRVTFDGAPVNPVVEKRVILLNKPPGVIVSVGDTHGRATVMDLLGKEAAGLYPVGRLDLDTSGVILLTDDGDLAHRLMHPSFGAVKVYRVEVLGSVGDDVVAQFRKGIRLDDGLTAPAVLRVLDRGDEVSMVEVTIHQGRKRQVKRMFEAAGHPVRTLERVSFAGLTAEGLSMGCWRKLKPEEVEKLRGMVGLGKENASRAET